MSTLLLSLFVNSMELGKPYEEKASITISHAFQHTAPVKILVDGCHPVDKNTWVEVSIKVRWCHLNKVSHIINFPIPNGPMSRLRLPIVPLILIIIKIIILVASGKWPIGVIPNRFLRSLPKRFLGSHPNRGGRRGVPAGSPYARCKPQYEEMQPPRPRLT